MKNFLVSIKIFLLFFIIGCGSGENKKFNDFNTTLVMSKIYKGKTNQALIDNKNQMIFLQAAYNLYFFDLITDGFTFDEENNKKIISNINPKTGIGSAEIIYSDYLYNPYNNIFIKFSGKVLIEIIELNKNHIKYNIKISDLYVKDINFEMLINADLTIYQDNDIEKINFFYLSILDKKLNENIFYHDLIYANDKTKDFFGKIYVEKEGFVDFKQKDYDIYLGGYLNTNISFNLWDYPKKVIFSNQDVKQSSNYYELDYKISFFKPPKISQCEIEINKNAQLLCDIEHNTSTYVNWYVNNKEIANIHTKILPYNLLQKGDNVQANIVAINNDISSLEHISTTVSNRAPVATIDKDKVKELRVDSTEFFLDIVYAYDPDGDPLEYRWNVENDNIKIINNTENSKIPQIKLLHNDVDFAYRVWLNVSDGDRTTEVYVDFDIKGEFFNKETIKVPINTLPYAFQFYENFKVIDLNKDGLNDIIFSSVTDNGMRIHLYTQTSDNNFSNYSFYDFNKSVNDGYNKFTAIASADLNNDGLLDLILSSKEQIKILYQNLQNGFQNSKNIILLTDNDYFDRVVIGDFNNDKLLDIATLDWMGTAVYLMIQTEDGNFSIPKKIVANREIINEKYDRNWIKVGDFNGDKKDDIVITNSLLGKVYLFIQNDDKDFSISEYSILNYSDSNDPLDKTTLLDISIGDINNDTKDDIVINTQYPDNMLLVYYGSDSDDILSSPQKISTIYKTIKTYIIDIEGDGKNEILTSNSVLKLNETGFEEILLDLKFSKYLMSTADYDFNKKEDVITIDPYDRNIVINLSIF